MTLTHAEARAHLHHGRRWLDNKTAAALDAHLAACAECRAYAADLDRLAPALAQALHARWDGVTAPRPRPRDEETPARPARRRLSPAFTVVPVGLVLLLGIILLPLLVAPPPAATPLPPLTQPVAGLPSPTPQAMLARVLFAVDRGSFSGPPEATTVESPPRVIAWDPVADRALWETEVGLEPSLAVHAAGDFVYVVSRPNAQLGALDGHTFDETAVAAHHPDWPLRVSVLDPVSGHVLQSVDLPTSLGPLTPLNAAGDTLYLYRFNPGTVDSLALAAGVYADGPAACEGGAFASSVQIAPDLSAVYALCWPTVANSGAPFVQLTPLGSGKARLVDLGPLTSPAGLLLSADGARLYVADLRHGLLGDIDTASARLARTSQFKATGPEGQSSALMALSADGRQLYVSALGGTEIDRVIRMVDLASLETVGVLDLAPALPQSLAARLDQLYVATDQGVFGSPVLVGSAASPSQQLPAGITQLVPYPNPVLPSALFFVPPDLSGQVAFESRRDGDSEIYVSNADGTAPRNLTQRPDGHDRAPVWSPDGRYLAYLTSRNDQTDVMVLHVDHALSTTDLIAPVRVYSGVDGFFVNPDLMWSPDGTLLAVTTWPGISAEPTAVYLLDVAAVLNGADNPAPLLAITGANGPKFSPDGTRLLYAARDEAGLSALFVHDLATGERLNLTAAADGGPWSYYAYAWSPSAKFIAYLRVSAATEPSPESTRAELVIATPDSSQHPVVMTLSPAPNGLYGLSYAPDGQMLLFLADRDYNGCWQLHLFTLEDQALARLEGVCYTSRTAFPSWSPDSRYLVFTAGWSAGQPNRGTGGDLELTLLDVAQALANPTQVQPFRLTHWVGDDLSPVFRP